MAIKSRRAWCTRSDASLRSTRVAISDMSGWGRDAATELFRRMANIGDVTGRFERSIV